MNADELIGLEQRYWQAIKDNDVETCVDLSANPVSITGAQGAGAYTKAQMRAMMEKEQPYTLLEFELKDVQARMITPDLGIIVYNVREKLIVEGKQVEFIAADSSAWARKNGKWECVLHTESIRGDAFGRDRK